MDKNKARDKKMHKVQKRKWKKSRFGVAPYKKATYYSFIFIIISAVFTLAPILLGGDGFSVRPPESVVDTNIYLKWVLTDIFAPHMVIYTMVYIASISILSMCDFSYLKWICKESFAGAFIHFLVFESLVFSLLMIFLFTEPSYNFSSMNSDTGSSIQLFMQSFVTLTLIVIPWYAYKTAWKAYREIGAQTISDRWNEYSKKLWFRNSGRAWERLVSRPLVSIFGLDGRKPRKGFLWVIVLAPVSISVGQSFGIVTGNYSVAGFMSILVLPVLILFIAARAKVKDGRPDSNKFLDIRRDEDTEDNFSMTDYYSGSIE